MAKPPLRALVLAAGLVRRVLWTGRPRRASIGERLANIPTQGLPLRAAVEIHWDQHQIPSIEAGNDWDLAVALGVVHAHLRLAQMEIMRRLASGLVSEVVGPAAIDLDRGLRLMRFGTAVPRMAAALDESSRRWAEGFLAGVNHHIAHAPALPYEFGLLDVAPRPWTLEDLLLIGRLAATDVSWLLFGRLLQGHARLGNAEWQALWPMMQAGDTLPLPRTTAEAALGMVRGSNSVAVAARGAAGRAGMIASDPHLSVTLPPLWLIVGLHAPGLDVVGLMIPGLPVTALGRNRWLAWGGTSLHAASSDLVDVSGEPMTERTEIIPVRGRAPVAVTLRETRFGPVVSDGLLLPSPNPLALRWVGHWPSAEMTAMLGVMRARNLEAVRAALAGFAVPGQTMVAVEAGPSGRAGRAIAAHLPRRANEPLPNLILSPDAVWNFEDLVPGASFAAPEETIAVSANDRPADTPVPVGFFFSSPLRARRMRALLEAGGLPGASAMRTLQLDVMQPGALALRDALLPRLGVAARQHDMARVLAGWNGSYDVDSAGALVFEVLASALARRLIPKDKLALLSAIWSGRALTAQLISDAPPAALETALKAAGKEAGRALRRYQTWGGVHRLELRHPLAALPGVGRWFKLAAHAAAGGNDTLNKTGHNPVRGRHSVTYGACARHVSDLAEPDSNWFVLLGGQDGWLGSDTATDQVTLWRAGQAIPVPLRAETARAAPHHTRLLPA